MMKALSDKKGLTYIDAVVWVLVLSMILSLIINFALVMVMIQKTEVNTKRVLDGFITQNSQEVYDNLKNGHDSLFSFDEDAFVAELKEELFLVEQGSALCCLDADGDVLFHITNPTVNYEVENVLKLNVTYNIVIPLSFDGHTVTTMSIPQKVVAYYNLK